MESSPPPPAAPGPLRVVAAPGQLPGFWEDSAVFVANLLGLFFGNEEETRMLAEAVGEVDSYGGRLVPVVDLIFGGGGGNLLVLEREPDPALCRYFEDSAGLSLPEQVILPHADYLDIGRDLAAERDPRHPAVERLAGHPAAWMDGYVTDDILSSLAARVGKRTFASPAGSRRGNNKLLLHQHLESAGLPVVRTELAGEPGEVEDCLARLEAAGFSSGVVKAPIGASGIGLIKVESLAARRAAAASVPGHFFTEGPCLVQGWLKPGEGGVRLVRSPSVQMFLDGGALTLYDITEQILSQSSVHEGNEAPPPYLAARPALREELLRQAGEAGSWLHRQGYRGTASADFLLAEREDGSAEVYVCELNARVTGATYPSVLARHFMPRGAWLMRNLRFRQPLGGQELLDCLRRSGDLFLPGQGETGIMPLNFNFGRDGLVHKGQFLCLARSPEASEALLRLAELDLPCVPDRD